MNLRKELDGWVMELILEDFIMPDGLHHGARIFYPEGGAKYSSRVKCSPEFYKEANDNYLDKDFEFFKGVYAKAIKEGILKQKQN